MRAFLAGVALIEFLGVLTLGMYLYPWRRLEIVALGLLMLAATLIFLRRFRTWRSNTGWFVIAAGGGVAIGAVCAIQLRTTRADNLPSLSTTRMRPAAPAPITRPYKSTRETPLDTSAHVEPWGTKDGESPTDNFSRHSMFPMDGMLAGYARTGDLRFLQNAETLALDWVRHNSAWILHPPSAFSWGDHSTALRLTRFLTFWSQWRKSTLFAPEKADLLERSILAHGTRLASPAFYTARHNHGLDQDIALSQLAAMVDGPLADRWQQTAQQRLRHTLADLVGPNGVAREHSPAYANAMLLHLAGFTRFLDSARLVEGADAVRETTARMRTALAAFVEPSGLLVPFGDTQADLRPAAELGLRAPVGRRVAAFADEGYAFIQEADTSGRPTWYLALTAASNRGLAHKHCDDLSFVLSSGSRRLLVDPGAFSYDPDEWRQYFLSCEAHNTVSSGGLFQQGIYFATGTGRASLGLAEDHESFAVASGRRELDSGGVHERILIWIRDHGFVVVDRVTGSPDPLRVSFHFGPGMRAQPSGDSALEVSDSGKVILRVRAHGPRTAWRITRGETRPIQGWISTSESVRIPADVITLADSGRSVLFVTEFDLSGPVTIRERRESAVLGLTSRNGTTALRFRARSEVWTIPVDGPLASPVRDSAASKLP